MNCPKCKNPIEENATVCEWCGASCVSKRTTNINENKSNSLDAELISLLEIGQKSQAINLYKERTGEPNVVLCSQYIERLDFF